MTTLNKAMLWVVTALAVAFLYFPSYAGALLGAGNKSAVTSDMNQAAIAIEGMTCKGCATITEQAIRNVPGVLAVEVDYQSKRAEVGIDACCPVPAKEILAALKKVGYRGSLIGS